MPILRAYLLGAAAPAMAGEAMVVVVEPNGDESRVVCRLKGAYTEIDFVDGHPPEYFHDRYGGPNAFSSVVRRAALGLSRREDLDEPTEAERLLRADFIQLRTTEAFEFARKSHGGRVWPGTHVPYLAHVMAVTATVLDYAGDEDEAVAALLFDVPDSDGPLNEIQGIFGERVARLVEVCRRLQPVGDEERFRHLVLADTSALLILSADRLNWALKAPGGDTRYLQAFSNAVLAHPECTEGARQAALKLNKMTAES